MNKIIIFISILFVLGSCRPLTTTLSSFTNKEITENEIESDTVEPKKKDYYRIPSGPIDDETNTASMKKKENFLIPSGPMDTEELLIAQAKSAAKEQALKRAEMAKKRKAAEAAKNEGGITANTGADIPRIDQLEDKQAKDAAKELLAKRAAMERAKRMEAAKIKEREERLANKESEDELKRLNEEKLAAEKAKAEAKLLALQKAEEARLLALKKEEEAKEEARLLALKKEEQAKEEARLLAIEKEKLEKIKEETAKAAAIAAEKLKELERLEAERLEKERLEQERIAQENAEREARNAAAIAAAKTEKERIEREQIAAAEAAAAAAKAEADRLEKERLAKEAAIAEAKAEADRLEKERLEKERIAKEAAIAEAKAEKERLENERIAAKKTEADRLEKERITAAKEDAIKKAAELAAAKQAEIKAEEERKKNLAKIATNTETIINEDAKTVATKEIDETEKEKAARYARQTLELQKEGDKKASWLLSKKEKEERKTFDNQPENSVTTAEPAAPRETAQPERMLKEANIPISIADMDNDPALNKINGIPTPTLKKYYFPIQDLETAKAYCFVSSGSTIDTTYWLMKSISFGGKSYLITEKYDHNFVMTSSSRERINELGAYVEDYTAYESSGLGGSIAVEYWVEDDEGFKWNMDNGTFAMVSMNFNSSDFPNYDITAYRERHLINGNATYSFKDKTLPAIVLEDRQTTVYVDNKSNEESYPSSYENYFAEGIGLVKYTINKRDKGFTLARSYNLSHIIPYEDWQRITK